MDIKNRGQKHTCHNCDAKFYDLGKAEATCPKCGTSIKHKKGIIAEKDPVKGIIAEKGDITIKDDILDEPIDFEEEADNDESHIIDIN